MATAGIGSAETGAGQTCLASPLPKSFSCQMSLVLKRARSRRGNPCTCLQPLPPPPNGRLDPTPLTPAPPVLLRLEPLKREVWSLRLAITSLTCTPACEGGRDRSLLAATRAGSLGLGLPRRPRGETSISRSRAGDLYSGTLGRPGSSGAPFCPIVRWVNPACKKCEVEGPVSL